VNNFTHKMCIGDCKKEKPIIEFQFRTDTLKHDKRVSIGINNLRIRRKGDVKIMCEYLYKDSSIHLDRKYKKYYDLFVKQK